MNKLFIGKVQAIIFKNGLAFQATRLFGKAGRKWLQSLCLPQQFQISLEKYLKLMEHLDQLVNEADDMIEKTVSHHSQANLLTSIPGVSYVSALTVMAEIGDINRFPSAKKLMGYASLVPSTYAFRRISKTRKNYQARVSLAALDND